MKNCVECGSNDEIKLFQTLDKISGVVGETLKSFLEFNSHIKKLTESKFRN